MSDALGTIIGAAVALIFWWLFLDEDQNDEMVEYCGSSGTDG